MIRRTPLCVDDNFEFKMSEAEAASALTIGGLVDPWEDALRKYSLPYNPDLFDEAHDWLQVMRSWKGERGGRLHHAAVARLQKSPMTLAHGISER